MRQELRLPQSHTSTVFGITGRLDTTEDVPGPFTLRDQGIQDGGRSCSCANLDGCRDEVLIDCEVVMCDWLGGSKSK